MKQWVQKLIDQLDYSGQSEKSRGKPKLSEERATLLYLLDLFNKHLIDIDTHPIRRVREQLDGLTVELMSQDKAEAEKALFRLRQFFATYRVAEYTYIRKTFEDFKGIIWNFVEQLSEDVQNEQSEESQLNQSLEQLKEAVEADSIDLLRAKSREFIDIYVEHHTKRETRRTKRMKGIKKNLDQMKQQLVEADKSLKTDHLTGAYNRRSFDDHLKCQAGEFVVEKTPVSLLILDIDFFKRINDTYGHDIGDFILRECVQLLQSSFGRDSDFVARIGGEEFAIVLSNTTAAMGAQRALDALQRIRDEVFVQNGNELRFTVSMGLAELQDGENTESWLKRADQALYKSKNSGRNQLTISDGGSGVGKVA